MLSTEVDEDGKAFLDSSSISFLQLFLELNNFVVHATPQLSSSRYILMKVPWELRFDETWTQAQSTYTKY